MSRKTKKSVAVKEKVAPYILSNGMLSTTGNWREFAVLAWGNESAAVKMMDIEIAESGEDFIVEMGEPQMKLLLSTLNDHPSLLGLAQSLSEEVRAENESKAI